MNNVLVGETVFGVIPNNRLPFVLNQYFQLNDKFNYPIFNSLVKMANPCFIRIKKDKLFFPNFHKINYDKNEKFCQEVY